MRGNVDLMVKGSSGRLMGFCPEAANNFLPWTTFGSYVQPCGEQFRAMALIQLTYRENLRDIDRANAVFRSVCCLTASCRE